MDSLWPDGLVDCTPAKPDDLPAMRIVDLRLGCSGDREPARRDLLTSGQASCRNCRHVNRIWRSCLSSKEGDELWLRPLVSFVSPITRPASHPHVEESLPYVMPCTRHLPQWRLHRSLFAKSVADLEQLALNGTREWQQGLRCSEQRLLRSRLLWRPIPQSSLDNAPA